MCGIFSGFSSYTLFRQCQTFNIKKFDNKKDFIKGSVIFNGDAAVSLLGLAHLMNRSGYGSLIGNCTSAQLTIPLLAFGALNSLVGGTLASSIEMQRRAEKLREKVKFCEKENCNLCRLETKDFTYVNSVKSIMFANIFSAAIPIVSYFVYKSFNEGPTFLQAMLTKKEL